MKHLGAGCHTRYSNVYCPEVLMIILKKIYRRLRRASGFDQPSHRAKTWDKNVHEELRYRYPLNADSIVFDLGGYEGAWTSEIFSRYCPAAIYVFEPVQTFADAIRNRFQHNARIHVFPYGLGQKDEQQQLSLSADGSSVFVEAPMKETIMLKKASDFFKEHSIRHIDLMKINIEGGEYDVLEHLIETGYIRNIDNVQVQFHDFVPNARERMKAIQAKLQETHRTTYAHEFVWENWERMM